ncbi:hypothetical protein MJO28_003673 [Puccinia striiformis f. sp. tritici]|uniref:Cytochrome c oxidase assembly protein COX20, mitochondrial n=5 Tax=Puccinia striiformis TaxID=27350 RepID=A0A0L0V1Y3_9BASI|nr:hypothetical protein Pst134EB_008790 [Puccinia striiformis f. sp. tritici]KAI9625038.1 hypothetical protein KEM48_008612 [Puccinia striiformis f. sp. tritici PST-130]KNE93312.1 hypothetical protein PSTG_13353 [Puccinia striiformis f. sp. tritici PST-78]POV95945.1 hypothetical protein PSTT_15946 [Puccinia striiformis]KAI7956578.1 hypothetical protein MJO28_003673 [Puccinia striiformis f. sp. tritici]
MASTLPPPPARPSTWEALHSFNLNENLQQRFARVPSQRKALLFGITGGTCIAGLRFISTRRGWSSVNWGVYSFVFLSSISYYELSKKRQIEVEQIHQVIHKMNSARPTPKSSSNPQPQLERIDEHQDLTNPGSDPDGQKNKSSWRFW